MKKRRLMPMWIAAAAALTFVSCDTADGKVGSSTASGDTTSSHPISDAVSDVGDGIGDVVSDIGEDVSDGVSDITGGYDDSDENRTDDNQDTDDEETDTNLQDNLQNDSSVATMTAVIEKKTA